MKKVGHKFLYSFLLTASLGSLVSSPALAQLAKRSQANLGAVKEVKRKKTGGAEKNKLKRSAIFAVEVEKKLIRGIDRTIAFYKKQLRKMSRGSGARLNVMMRVLDLNLEQASYVRNEEERLYDRRWTAWDNGGRRGREPKISTAKSFRYWKGVIRQADSIQKEYPRNKSADKVHFTKAFSYGFINREKEAAKIYTQLIQRYPNSSTAGDAYASLGDFYFDRNDFRNALNNYKSALKYRRSNRYLWAVFKLGWCNYNLGRNRDALKYWKQVVRLGRAQGNTGLKLREEALRDMVYAFAEIKDVKGAIAYYRANGGGKYIGGLLNLLAQELADDGNYVEAIKTWKLFQQLLRSSPEAPEAQKELILLYYELGKMSSVWRELNTLHSMYGGAGSWASANSKDRRLVQETRKMVKDQVIYYAKIMHKKAQKTSNDGLYKQAKIGYAMFMKKYPRSKEIPEVKFFVAEVEFELKNYREAGRQYLDITLRGKKNAYIYDPSSGKPVENVHKKAAIYMIDSYARDFSVEFKAMKKRKPNFKKTKRPLSPRAKNYIRACDVYVKAYPKDKKLVKTCEVDIARIYYYSNDKMKSREYLKLIALKYPNTKEGPEAVDFLIPLYADEEVKLLAIAERFLKIPAYQKGKLGRDLRNLKQASAKKAVEKIKDSTKRAKAYENLARKNPKDPEADKLWYLAASNYLKGGAVSQSIAANLALVKSYPKSSLAKDALLDTAKLFDKRLEFAKAAVYFQEFNRRYPKDPKAKGTLAKSCDLLLAIDSNKAESNCMAFVSRYPSEGKDVVDRLIVSAERARRYNQMSGLINRRYLPKYRLSSSEKVVAYNRMYRAAKGRGPGAQKAASAMLGELRRGSLQGQALRHANAILFRQANGAIGPYSRIKLAGGNVNNLQTTLQRKSNALLKLKEKYTSVLKTGEPYWGVAALHQIGIAYEQFAMMLESPPSVAGAKKSEVTAQLAPQAKSIRQEALAAYKQAYSLVRKFKVYNEYSIKVINAFFRVTNENLSFDDYIIAPDFMGAEVSPSIASKVDGRGN